MHGGQWQRQAEQSRASHQTDLADVRRKQVHQIFLDVAEHTTTFFHCGNDGGEVVIGEGHSGGFFGHVGASDAHGNADVRFLKGGCIVHAVACHGDDMFIGLQRCHHAQLVSRGDARIHVDGFDFAFEIFIGDIVKFCASDHTSGFEQAKFTRHSLSGEWMVTSDHHGANACAFTDGDRFFGFRTRRVDHASQPKEGHASLS